MWVANLTPGRAELHSPRGVARRTNYYAAEDKDGALDQGVERILQRAESAAAEAFGAVKAGHLPLDPVRKENAALFMALLVTRLASWRAGLEETAGKLAASVMELAARHPEYFERHLRTHGGADDPAEIEKIRKAVLDGEFEYRGTPELSLSHMLGVGVGLSGRLVEMRWTFVRPPAGGSFLTSDHPINWNDPTAPPPFNVGLGSPGTLLTFPIDARLCLMARHRSGPDLSEIAELPQDLVDNVVNSRAIRFAAHQVYTASRAMAKAALERREAMKAAGEPVGPRPMNLRIITEHE